LARSVLGEYRAVKIIRRDGFDRDRPVERELEGIQKYEPISRGHEHQVHILHVGRFDGGFFYVMELADDATVTADVRRLTLKDAEEDQSLLTSAATYAPRTLRSEIQRHGRLPLAECLDIALKLTDALAHLHGHGLVHRDVKPSNIIFVRGQPKLADIGLVATADSTMSFVGTEGFLPPEGPGRPQADLYALGKVLYEITTGRDRHDFPELPTLLREDPERRALEEFNEVILQACDPDTRQRYGTARAMHADLELLRAGESLQRRRSRARVWARAKVAVVAMALGLGIVSAVYWLIPEPRVAAPPAPRRLAVEEWRGMFDISPDGQRIAFAPSAGIRLWDRTSQTTRPLKLVGAEAWTKRGISGWVGLPCWAPDNRRLAFLPMKQIGGSEQGPVTVFAPFVVDTTTGVATQFGPEQPEPERVHSWCWRPDGQALTCVTKDGSMSTLTLAGERSVWPESGLPKGPAMGMGDYSPDGRWLVLWVDANLPTRGERDVWLLPHGGGRAVQLTSTPGFEGAPTWAPDGKSVYFVSDGGSPLNPTRGIWNLRIDASTGRPRGPAREVFAKKGQELGRPKILAGGDQLFYFVTESNTRIWVGDAATPAQGTSVARGRAPVLSPDGQTIYFVGETPEQQGIFAIDRQGATRPRRLGAVVPTKGHFPASFLRVSPDGEWLVLPGFDGAVYGLFLVPTGGGAARLIEVIQRHKAISPVWSPDGQWVAYAADTNLVRVSRDLRTREVLATLAGWDSWNVRWSPDGAHIAALAYARPEDFTPPEELNHVMVVSVADKSVRRLTPDSEDKYKEGLEWHPDSKRLTYFYYGPEKYSAKMKWAFLDQPGRVEEMFDQEGHWDYVGVWAPDGRHFHFTSSPDAQDHKNIHVFDAQTGQFIHGLRDGYRPEWSRDGRTMVWGAGGRDRYFEVIENFARSE
jgi:Tol biopolymer transport system component